MATNVTAVTAAPAANAGPRRFGLLLQASLLMYLRNRTAVFWNILFPIGLMLLFGTIYGTQKAAIPFLASGMVVLSLIANGLIGNAGAMAVWRERGILRRVQTTPLPVWQLLLARIVTQAGVMVVQAGLLLATSVLVFGAQYDLGGMLAAIPAVVVGAVLFMAGGQAVAALVQKAETVNIVAQVIYFPLMFLGNVMIPIAALPDSIQAVCKYLPTSMIADLVRTPLLGANTAFGGATVNALPLPVDLLGVALYFVAAVFVATRFFKWS